MTRDKSCLVSGNDLDGKLVGSLTGYRLLKPVAHSIATKLLFLLYSLILLWIERRVILHHFTVHYMNLKSKRNATELYPIQDHRNGTLKVTQPMPVCHFTYMFNIISEMHQSLSVTDSRRPQSPQSRHCCLLFISFNNSTTHMRHMRRLIHPGHPRRIPYRSPLPVLAAHTHVCL